eukprot:13419893-Alexandrium_andersonii.AAC.1
MTSSLLEKGATGPPRGSRSWRRSTSRSRRSAGRGRRWCCWGPDAVEALGKYLYSFLATGLNPPESPR